MKKPVVEMRGLTKFYGRVRGISDLDLEISEGEVFGYLGPNGAGKTTTIRILLDFIRPTRGSASIFGLDTRHDSLAIRTHVGYLPGELSLYPNLTGYEMARYFSRLRKGVDWQYVSHLAKRLNLNMTRKTKELSSGNKHKLGLVLAFMHRPELLILDEPTTGLDPLVQQEFHRLLDEARGWGATVLLSSHVLPEVERICDRVAVIRDGSLVAVEEVAKLKAMALRRLEITFSEPVPAAEFQAIPEILNTEVKGSTMRCTIQGDLDRLIKTAAKHRVVSLTSQEPDLEEIFLSYYGGENNRSA